MVESSCEDLTTYFCTDSLPAAFQTCGLACVDTAPNAFFCANGSAVAPTSQCDGAADCADGSDEVGCQGPCADGTTMITYADLCNGVNDCPEGEDEFSCFAVCGEN
jgi:hypothetical protein